MRVSATNRVVAIAKFMLGAYLLIVAVLAHLCVGLGIALRNSGPSAQETEARGSLIVSVGGYMLYDFPRREQHFSGFALEMKRMGSYSKTYLDQDFVERMLGPPDAVGGEDGYVTLWYDRTDSKLSIRVDFRGGHLVRTGEELQPDNQVPENP